ncbi:CpsD/CapB family tyrosine-protein kinase [uncultured Shimia sp.]|uniref:tyrosine-protein kinase family protein n=1 Tax=uncultured Shimia sp. TaxID=573152 RepID=UPI002631C5B6|nr:CpsD/CapB family tyrosine-protein kinase [uncultured Shimia sp.]
MERLQAAMEKARAQRDQTSPTSAAPAAPAEHPPESKQATSTTPPKEEWQLPPALSVDRKLLHRNRVTTVEGGLDSAPFDLLRTRVLQQARQNEWKRIAIVSPHAGCGKSTATANLAFGLSRQSNLYSLIFDFDLRRAGLTKIMGQRLNDSMAAVLERKIGFQSHARRLGTNLAFGLNGGPKAKNPSEILQNSMTTEVLDEISAQYEPDIMLFDMPPLMASDDNFGFLQNVDCALIMVAAEQTSMSQIDVAERHVAELTNVMGIVLNKCRYSSGAHGHEYDYY